MQGMREADERKRMVPACEPAVRVERRLDGQLWLRGRVECPVWVRRCFPWSAPLRFVSLRNRDDEEVALVRDLDELDRGSRAALEEALAEAGFVLEIEAVLEVEDEIEIRRFRVRTRQGERRFQTLRDELGTGFEGIEIDSSKGNPHAIPGSAHSVLTADLVDEAGHPTRESLDRVLAFFEERLKPAAGG